MPKNTPKIARHPKTGKVLTNPPKIKHDEKKKNKNDVPLLNERTIENQKTKKENIKTKQELEQISELETARQADSALSIYILVLLIFGIFTMPFFVGTIGFFMSKDLYVNKNIKHFLLYFSLLEILISIFLYFVG